MRKATCFIFSLALFSLSFTTSGTGQILYEDHFTDGTTDITWHSAWFDSAGNPLTPMEVDSVGDNPSGDGWVGAVTGDSETLGGLGLAWAGRLNLTNYSMEAEVYVALAGGYYDAIMVRIDGSGDVIRGYQLAANFNTMYGAAKIKFRRYYTVPDSIVTLAEWSGNDIPGGPPTVDGWHKMEIVAEGDEFRCFWDEQELPGGPIIDSVLESGPFGVYVFDFTGSSTTLVDDVIVRSVGPPYKHREAIPPTE
jgi:hypothetical protein